MKKGVLVILLVVIFAFPAYGQLSEIIGEIDLKPEYHLAIGMSTPTKPNNFSENWKTGYDLRAGLGLQISNFFSIVANFDLYSFPFDEGVFDQFYGLSGYTLIDSPTWKSYSATLNLKYAFEAEFSKLRPYLTGGGGFYGDNLKDWRIRNPNDFEETIEGEKADVMGATFGVGIQLTTTKRIDLFLEGRFTTGFTDLNSTQNFAFIGGIIFR